jgi:hypothetical protein
MGTIWTFLGAILAAVITGVIGNSLIQRWQQRNWYAQQRQLGYQEELKELSILVQSITERANARLFTMTQLENTIWKGAPSKETMARYNEEVREWNVLLPSFYTRLTLLLDSGLTYVLEQEVQKRFVSTSVHLHRAIAEKSDQGFVTPALREALGVELEALRARLRNFLLGTTRKVAERRSTIRDGRLVYYRDGDLSEYSTFKLFKLLFTPEVDGIYIVRPA